MDCVGENEREGLGGKVLFVGGHQMAALGKGIGDLVGYSGGGVTWVRGVQVYVSGRGRLQQCPRWAA